MGDLSVISGQEGCLFTGRRTALSTLTSLGLVIRLRSVNANYHVPTSTFSASCTLLSCYFYVWARFQFPSPTPKFQPVRHLRRWERTVPRRVAVLRSTATPGNRLSAAHAAKNSIQQKRLPQAQARLCSRTRNHGLLLVRVPTLQVIRIDRRYDVVVGGSSLH